MLSFQLVSSATENSSSDAFKFISLGAGDTVFEVFLKVGLPYSLHFLCDFYASCHSFILPYSSSLWFVLSVIDRK